MRRHLVLILTSAALLVPPFGGISAFAKGGGGGRGGGGGARGGGGGARGGGGGFRGGGGGGYRGGAMMRAPAMSMRAPAMRSYAGVGARSYSGVGASAYRGGAVAGRGYANAGIAGNRGIGNQGNYLAGGGGLNRGGYGGYGSGLNRAGYGAYGGYRNYGGYGRGYGGYGGYGLGYGGLGYGGLGYGGLGYGGFGYGLGGGLGLGLLLGYGLGGYGGYGGYGGGYGGYGGYGGGGGYGGYSNWGYPSSGYSSAYGAPYENPYVTAGYSTNAYDYTQPLSSATAVTPDQTNADRAAALFTQARDTFKAGDANLALQQADSALALDRGDTSLHEFRGLCLFALGRYDEAAVPLYAVLAAGPGWDWPSLIGLYPNIEVFTAQLRRLQAFVNDNPQSSTSRFVLAYHYLTEGHTEAAAKMLREVVALKPSDAVATRILQQIQASAGGANAPGGSSTTTQPAASASAPPINTAVPEGATIGGSWTAKPNADTSVALTIQPDGAFQWDLTLKGQPKKFTGTAAFSGGILTLVPENVPPIVGKVSWADVNHMTFHAIGGPATDPGLSFSKQQ